MDMVGHLQHDLLGHILDRPGNIHILLGNCRLRLTRRAAEKFMELTIGHCQSRAIIEILHVQFERPVFFYVDKFFSNKIAVFWFPVGR